MYTKKDYEFNRSRITKRMILLMIPEILLLAALVWSFIVRIKWLTMGLTILMGAIYLFVDGLAIAPLRAYGRHLANALTGRTRQTAGMFKEMEMSAVQREGVMYFPMLISVGDPMDPEDDRLFYYDANIERPNWQVGEHLSITAHDKFVTAWARVVGA